MKAAILDDYQNVALKLADWCAVARRAEITVFSEHLADPEAVVERLTPFYEFATSTCGKGIQSVRTPSLLLQLLFTHAVS
jgi:hypothetical protein